MFVALRLLTLIASYPSAARADDRKAEYDAAVRIGLDEYSAGNYPEALAAMKHAHELNANARTFRGMGVTAFEMREYVDALEYLTAALTSNVNPLSQNLRASTEQLLNRTRLNVGTIALELRPESGVTVRVDGKPVAIKEDGILAVNVGERTLEFDAPGYASTTRIFTVESGKPLRATVVLQRSSTQPHAASAATTIVPLEERLRGSEGAQKLRRSAWWTFGAAGATAVGGALALGIRELRARQYVAADCMPPLSDDCLAQRRVVSTTRVAGIVLLSTAGALTVGATALLWKAQRSASRVQAQVDCTMGLGLSCGFAF